jgi:hypothetical protein
MKFLDAFPRGIETPEGRSLWTNRGAAQLWRGWGYGLIGAAVCLGLGFRAASAGEGTGATGDAVVSAPGDGVSAGAGLSAGVDVGEASQYWPQWRGPWGTGVGPHARPPVVWGETNNIRWKIALPGTEPIGGPVQRLSGPGGR